MNTQLKLVYRHADCQFESRENDHVKIRRASFDTCFVICKGWQR